MKSFLTSISLLTIIPVPQRWTKNLSTSSVYFCLTGFFIGVIYYAAAYTLKIIGIDNDWVAFVILFLMIFITRAFHLDGLADMADGFWGGKDRDHTLKIMKDSSVGVFGVLALILICFLKWIAIKFVLDHNSLWIFISSAAVSRFSMTLLSGLFHYARENGTGSIIINSTSIRHVLVALLYCSLLMVFFLGLNALYIVFVACTISVSIGLYSYLKINGITGDILGASSEITEGLLLAITPYLTLSLANHFGTFSWSIL